MIMRSTRLGVTLGLAALAAVGALAGCAKKGGDGAAGGPTLKVGVYGSLTGSDATFGQSTKKGIELAVKEINAAGGIGGATIVLKVEDDQGRPEEAATVVDKLISQDNVIAVVGEVASSRSIAAAPKCQTAGVPMISPSSTNPEVTKKGDYIFRVCFIDPFQGTAMAKFVHDNLGKKNVAILKDVKSDYSVGLAQFFTETFTQLGGKVVAEESYSAGDQDFKAQLTALKAKNPDALFIPGYYTEVGLIARQAKDIGLNVPLTGGDGWDSADLVKIGGEAIKGAYFSTHYSAQDTSSAIQSYLTKFKAAYNGEVPDGIGALAYDAGQILAAALTRVHEKNPDAFKALLDGGQGDRKAAEKLLRDEIAATANFAGVTGTITLNAERNAVKPAVVVQITDDSIAHPGSYAFTTKIAP